MKIKVCISLLLCGVLLFGCSPKDTPTRIGKFVAQADYRFDYDTIEKVITDSEILAEVEITEWLGETDDDSNLTFFSAKILKEYTNKTQKRLNIIKLIQSGNSNTTFANYPLFDVGNKLLIGINEALNFKGDGDDTYKGYYHIVGGPTTAMQIRQANGKDYAITYYPVFKELKELNQTRLAVNSVILKIKTQMDDELNLDEKQEYQQSGGYIDITYRNVIEADKLREYLNSLTE